jgi:hypothetical protein
MKASRVLSRYIGLPKPKSFCLPDISGRLKQDRFAFPIYQDA